MAPSTLAPEHNACPSERRRGPRDLSTSHRCAPARASGSLSASSSRTRVASLPMAARAKATTARSMATPCSRSAPSPRCLPPCCSPTWRNAARSSWTIRWRSTCRPRSRYRSATIGRSLWWTLPRIRRGCRACPRIFQAGTCANPYADYAAGLLYAYLSSHELTRTPGAGFEYSDTGFGLLGHALARRAGMDYEALVETRICRPLGMKSTRIALSPELRARLAAGHDADL